MGRSTGRRKRPFGDLDVPEYDIPKFPEFKDPYFEMIREDQRRQEQQYQRDLRESTTIAQRNYYEQMAQKAQAERQYTEILIRREKERAEKEYWDSPEGRRRMQKDTARHYYLRSHIIDFFWNRPIALINQTVKKVNAGVTYKNYISIIFWILWIIVPIIYGLLYLPAVFFGSIFLMIAIYYVKFEFDYKP